MKTLSLACMFAATLASAQPASAPSPSPAATRASRVAIGPMPVGSRTRIHATSAREPLIGTLRAVDDATLTIETPGGALLQTPLHEVRSLEVWTAPRRKSGKWALIGAFVGSAGLAVAASTLSDNTDEAAHGVAYGLVFGAVGGAALGGLGGAFVHSGGWTSVPMAPIQQTALESNNDREISSPGPPMPRTGGAVATFAPPAERSRPDFAWRLRPTFRDGAGLALNLAW